MRCFSKTIPALMLTTLFAVTQVPAATSPEGTLIIMKAAEKPSALATLARHLGSADHDRQWEFAAIMLDVLLEAYDRELQASMHEKASTPARRAKLSRWRRATRGLTAQLEAARLGLAGGAALSLYVDPKDQILLIIGGQAIVASGPRGMNDDAITRSVLDQYCAYNLCDMLPSQAVQRAHTNNMTTGTWALRQEMRPSYELDSGLACEFESLGGRERKAQVCVQLATELGQIEQALRKAITDGHIIDWKLLLATPPGATAPYIVLNRHGDHLRQQLQLLNKVAEEEWQDMLEWMRHGLENSPRRMLIHRTDRFLPD